MHKTVPMAYLIEAYQGIKMCKNMSLQTSEGEVFDKIRTGAVSILHFYEPTEEHGSKAAKLVFMTRAARSCTNVGATKESVAEDSIAGTIGMVPPTPSTQPESSHTRERTEVNYDARALGCLLSTMEHPLLGRT
jgi:hypothetical protein